MELLIVVAGVLIALWLQEWVEQRRALEDMRSAETAVHDEVRATLQSLIWREAIRRCHRERAQLLYSRLLESGDHWPGVKENALTEDLGTLPGSVTRSVYPRPVDVFTDAAWTSALTTGALGRIDRNRFDRLVTLYDRIQYLRRTREIEDQAAARLSPLSEPLELTPDLRAEMLQAVYDIDRTRFAFELQGSPTDFAASMRRLGWNDAAEIDRWIAEDKRNDARIGMKFRPCIAPAKNPFRTSD
jgi:hypothetical protein